MSTRVVITQVGALSVAGAGTTRLRALLDGAPAAPKSHRSYPLDDGGSFGVRYAPVRFRTLFDPVPPRLTRLDRYPKLFLAAGMLALQGVPLTSAVRDHTGVAVGSAFGCWGVDEQYLRGLQTRGLRLSSPLHFGYTVPGSAAGELSIAGQLRGPNATWIAGRSAGLQALSQAIHWIQRGAARAVVAGAADAQGPWLARELRDEGWSEGRAGEGAAAFLLEREEDARDAGRRVLAEVAAGDECFDPMQVGHAWSVPRESPWRVEALGDAFAAHPLLQLAAALAGHEAAASLVNQDGWRELRVMGPSGHGASLRYRTGVS